MFEYLWWPLMKVTIYCVIFSAVLVYTPVGPLMFKSGVLDAMFKVLDEITPKEDIFSLEDFGARLTGGRSELIYGPISEQQKRRNNRKEK